MQQWEYCVVGNLEGELRAGDDAAHLFKLTNKGAELVADVGTILKGLPKGAKLRGHDVVAQIIAQLGEDGWEMVGAASNNGALQYELYFKRPKP